MSQQVVTTHDFRLPSRSRW